MKKLYVLFFLVLLFNVSCTFFSSSKKEVVLDTIVNLKSIDVYPSFFNCDSLLDAEKAICFRNTMKTKVLENFTKYNIQDYITSSQNVEVQLIIDAKGAIHLKSINYLDLEERDFKLDSLIQLSLVDLPRIRPAIKRGIPVTTQYTLPININIKE